MNSNRHVNNYATYFGHDNKYSVLKEQPLLVIKYDPWKMLGRFICFWGPMMLLLIVMINSAIRQSKWIMFSVFILFLIGSVFYWMQILNTKEFIIYSNHIVKRKMMLDNVKCALADAIYSNYTLWFRELIVITNQNNNLVIFYGFIKRSNMVKFYNILSQLTGEAPEKLDRKCNLHFNAAMESKGERE